MPNTKRNLTTKFFGAAVAAAALIAPAMASAQSAPDYAIAGRNQQIQGTVSAINGTWNITVADANGYDDSVQLHEGTIINPTGLTLAPGMNVTIDGNADGSNFDAVEIDTPYQYSGPAPVAVYYGVGNWYPGYAYGWGPSFTLAFDFGSRRYEQRAFNYNGQVRHAIAPPAGWENRAHGYIGNASRSRTISFSQRTFATQQPQQRTFAQPQQQAQRIFSPQQQQQRTFAQPQLQPHAYGQPVQQQQRSVAQPQQPQRNYAPQQRTNASPRATNNAPRENHDNGDRHHG